MHLRRSLLIGEQGGLSRKDGGIGHGARLVLVQRDLHRRFRRLDRGLFHPDLLAENLLFSDIQIEIKIESQSNNGSPGRTRRRHFFETRDLTELPFEWSGD
jgi:hypothetical protein